MFWVPLPQRALTIFLYFKVKKELLGTQEKTLHWTNLLGIQPQYYGLRWEVEELEEAKVTFW